jgi:hypothetical protein
MFKESHLKKSKNLNIINSYNNLKTFILFILYKTKKNLCWLV